MIELKVPYRVLPTGKVMGLRMGNAYHSVDYSDQERKIFTGLRDLYYAWLKENDITEYGLVVQTIPNKEDGSTTLLSMIHFNHEEDAMAFKLVWL